METAVQEQRGTLHRLDETGDTITSWRRSDDFEIAAAKSAFDSLRGEGFMAYRLDGDGGGTILKDFDAEAERIVMAPPLVGG